MNVRCKYCHRLIKPWQRWTEILDGFAHSECCWKHGFKEGKKLEKRAKDKAEGKR